MNDDRQRYTMTQNERRTVDGNSDTVRQAEKNRETHGAATHRGVVKNQHWTEKCSDAEKRSADF